MPRVYIPPERIEGELIRLQSREARYILTVLRLSPNSRAACRMLIPSTCTTRLTHAYMFTEYTSQVSQEHTPPALFDCSARGWSASRPPQAAA